MYSVTRAGCLSKQKNPEYEPYILILVNSSPWTLAIVFFLSHPWSHPGGSLLHLFISLFDFKKFFETPLRHFQ